MLFTLLLITIHHCVAEGETTFTYENVSYISTFLYSKIAKEDQFDNDRNKCSRLVDLLIPRWRNGSFLNAVISVTA